MRDRDERFVYSVTLNGIQSKLIEGMVEEGLRGLNASDVIRRILDAEFQKMVDTPKIKLT